MMETPNLMDVPTRATRRMERYGVLALVFFLTTFGVLYLWEGDMKLTPTSHASETVAVRVPPSSRNRPERALPSGDALTAPAPLVSELPLSRVTQAQRELAQMREGSRAERESSMAQRAAESAISRNNAARYFEGRARTSEVGTVDATPDEGSRVYAKSTPKIEASSDGQPMEYVVKSGDSLSMIAQDELGTVKHLQRLRDYNGLSSDFLRAGQILILPQIGDVAPVRGTSIQQPKRSLEGEWMKVTVIEGQSLWKIAAKHLGDGARYTEIMAWNDLSSEMVHPGRTLRLREELVMSGGR